MKDKNQEKVVIILLGLIVIILLGILIVLSWKFKENNKNTIENSNGDSGVIDIVPDDDNSSLNEEESNYKPNDTNINNKPSNSLDNSDINTNTNTNTNTNVNQSTNDKEDVTYQESDVVAYFEELNQNIDTFKNTNDVTIKDKIKNGFITIVDFLFYGKQIKGYTFDELTNEAKIKVLTLSLKIDNKIEEYIPNYKEIIKDKASAFKEKVALLYLETTAKLCDSIGEKSCDLARENFKDMKESFGFTWDGIKKAASESSDKLTILLKEWYQSIKN